MSTMRVVAAQLHSILYVLLIAVVVTFVWGAVTYFSGITAALSNGRHPLAGSTIDQAANALRFCAICIAFAVPLLLLGYGALTEDRDSVPTNRRLAAWAWLVATIPLIVAAVAFGDLNFVRPDLVDEASAPGLAGSDGTSLMTRDPVSGEQRWVVSRSGAPDGPSDIRVVGEGGVILVIPAAPAR